MDFYHLQGEAELAPKDSLIPDLFLFYPHTHSQMTETAILSLFIRLHFLVYLFIGFCENSPIRLHFRSTVLIDGVIFSWAV